MTKKNLKALSKEDLVRCVSAHGLPPYRGMQLVHWIYEKCVTGIDEITEFSKELRNTLSSEHYISNLAVERRLISTDGTEKFLFSLEDGETIESVLIPDKHRLTLCISSQVGCSMGCRFCLTAEYGLVRNLESYEIVDQILAVNRTIQPRKVTNIVLMGMGEPLANFENVVEALWRIVGLLGISKRRVTLSTAGVVPKIALLPQKAPEINLAVSLNATTDELREEIMPISKRYPMRSLLSACRKYPLASGRRITLEYVLIGGKNDLADDARRLAGLLRGIRCKVNLIPLNPHVGSDFKRPDDRRVRDFQGILMHHGVRALVRESKGRDILAACGQLRGAHKNTSQRSA